MEHDHIIVKCEKCGYECEEHNRDFDKYPLMCPQCYVKWQLDNVPRLLPVGIKIANKGEDEGVDIK